MLNPPSFNNLHNLQPELASRVIKIAENAVEIKKQELEHIHQRNMLILAQRDKQLERDYSLKVWSLAAALLITSLTVLGGIYLVVAGYENPGILAIAVGAGFTIVSVLFKRAGQLLANKFQDHEKSYDPPP